MKAWAAAWVGVCLACWASGAAAQPDWYTSQKSKASAADEDPAQPCAQPAWAPIATALRDSGFDAAANPCLTTSLTAWTRALALIDTPEFYGTVSAAMFAELRWRYLSDFELSVGTRLIDYRFAQNAVVTGDELSAGPLYLAAASAADVAVAGRPLTWAWKLRFDVPWTDTSSDVAVIAASPQLAAVWALARQWRIHGRMAALLWAARPPGDVLVRRAGLASSEVAWTPLTWLSVAGGAETQVGWYGLGLDHFMAKIGARFAFGPGWRMELGVSVPLAGSERTDAAALLGVSHQL